VAGALRLTDIMNRSLAPGTDRASGAAGLDAIQVSGLTADSRAVQPGFLFAALPGVTVNGVDFIPDAVRRGAAAVLAPAGGGLPLPSSLSDWLGVLGGMAFALNNVMLRREAGRSPEARALAMFSGGVLVSALAAGLMAGQGLAPWPALASPLWLLPLAGMSVLFFLSNLSLQYGAARLPANVTAIVMLCEVPFAALSSLAWGGGSLGLRTALGGLCIVGAALLAALEKRRG